MFFKKVILFSYTWKTRRGTGPSADTHSAVHSGDGGSEDPILERLLNRTSGDSATQHVKESHVEGKGRHTHSERGARQSIPSPPRPRQTHRPRRGARGQVGSYHPSSLSKRGAKRGFKRRMSPANTARETQTTPNRPTTYETSVLPRESPTLLFFLKSKGKKTPKPKGIQPAQAC